METIRNLVQASRKQMTMPCSNTLPSVSVENKAWLTKWKDPSDIERVFSPTNWAYVSQNPEKAYFSNCPTIQKYDEVYGEGNAEMWIYAQVLALFGSSSCKDEGVAQGIGIFAQTFASSVQIYKLSELMLFFLDTSPEDTITLFLNLMPEGLEMLFSKSLFQRDRKKLIDVKSERLMRKH